jgi:toxin YoeB
MELRFAPKAQEDRDFWKKSDNKTIMKRISVLLTDIKEHPYTGIGKPEKLRHELSGKWSRRINNEHRIIYSVNENDNIIDILALLYHYTK